MLAGIRRSLPPLDIGLLDDERFDFLLGCPAGYVRLLAHHNGGVVDEFACTFLTGVPFQTKDVDNPSRDDCLVELYGLRQERGGRDVLSVRRAHAAEQFLPRDVVAIGSCIQNSLVCLSLRDDDSFGAVFYWDWYWQYPWCKAFFEARIAQAKAAGGDADALNFATLVKQADSLDAWLAALVDRREPDE